MGNTCTFLSCSPDCPCVAFMLLFCGFYKVNYFLNWGISKVIGLQFNLISSTLHWRTHFLSLMTDRRNDKKLHIPGNALMSMTACWPVWLLMITSMPNRDTPSACRSDLVSSLMTSSQGGWDTPSTFALYSTQIIHCYHDSRHKHSNSGVVLVLRTYRGQVWRRLWFGDIVTVEKDGFPVWNGDKEEKKDHAFPVLNSRWQQHLSSLTEQAGNHLCLSKHKPQLEKCKVKIKLTSLNASPDGQNFRDLGWSSNHSAVT